MQGFSALNGFDVEICYIRTAIANAHANLEVIVQHHVILPKSSWAIVYAEDSFLHFHLVFWTVPGDGVMFPPPAPFSKQWDAPFRSCHTAASPT